MILSSKFKKLTLTLIILITLMLGWGLNNIYQSYFLKNNFSLPEWQPTKKLEKYQIENLKKFDFKSAKIEVEKDIFENQNYKSSIFSFKYNHSLSQKEKDLKRVTGLINTPVGGQKYPIAVLIRGYVDPSIYQSGVGTKRVGEYLAENEYITIAPDFLGYGGSDQNSADIFESRFQTYVTVLGLMASINKENFPNWDERNIFIWAHSNGGQIALTYLAISQKEYPTVLWAPVTASFPYSILYYTNESADQGKFIRKNLAEFEKKYDVDKFSFDKYLNQIKAPISLHIGTNDDAIPLEWTDEFVSKVKKEGGVAEYYKHPGADHNMNPLWGDAVKLTLEFFNFRKRD